MEKQITAADEPGPGPVARHRWLFPIVATVGAVIVVLLGQLLTIRAHSKINLIALADSPLGVTVVSARAAVFRPSRVYVGRFAPWLESHLGPQLISAYVTSVRVRPGDTVHRNDVVATLDCDRPQANAESAAQEVRARGFQRQALTALTARVSQLLPDGFIAPNEVDLRRAASDRESAQVVAATSRLRGRALMTSDCLVRAPFDGDVIERSRDPGAFVRPDESIATIIDRSIVRVTAAIPEQDFSFVAPGTPVRVRPVTSQTEIPGAISRRSPTLDRSMRTVHIEIDLSGADASIPVDVAAELMINAGTPVDALELPLIAADVHGSDAALYHVVDGVAHLVHARVLGERGGSVFVSTVIPAGALVVTEGRTLLLDGDHVSARSIGPLQPAQPQRPATVAEGPSGVTANGTRP